MVEDAIHYFFRCRKFTIERRVFNDTFRVFQPLSIYMILYGNFNLNMENNIVLFRAVQIHIHADQICSIPKMKGFLAIELFFLFS